MVGIAFALSTAGLPGQSEDPYLPAGTGSADTVESLVLRRSFREGQVFSYAAVGRTYRQTVVSTGGAVVEEDLRGMRCELAAALSVESVRDDGRPRELGLRVFRLVIRDGFVPRIAGGDDVVTEPFERGTELRVSYPAEGAGQPRIELAEGGKLGEVAEAALRLVLPEAAGSRDDDLMFGRDGPARVGESWRIVRDETARALREGGIEVEPDLLEGDVTLESRDPETGRYAVGIELRGLRAGVPLPAGYATRSGVLSARLGATLPADERAPPLAERSEYTLRSEALGREGDTLVAVDIAFYQARSARYRRVGAK